MSEPSDRWAAQKTLVYNDRHVGGILLTIFGVVALVMGGIGYLPRERFLLFVFGVQWVVMGGLILKKAEEYRKQPRPAQPAATPPTLSQRGQVVSGLGSHLNFVTLPRDQGPVFPKNCVVCLQPSPGASVEVRERSGLLQRGASLLPVTVPACAACGERLTKDSQTQELLRYVIPIAAIVLSGAVYLRFPDLGRAGGLITFTAVVVPFMLWWYLEPWPIEMRNAGSMFARYQFRNRDYAKAFAEANGAKLTDLWGAAIGA